VAEALADSTRLARGRYINAATRLASGQSPTPKNAVLETPTQRGYKNLAQMDRRIPVTGQYVRDKEELRSHSYHTTSGNAD